MKKNLKTATLCIHAGHEPKNGEPRQLPIIQSTTFKYDNTEEMALLFDLKKEGYFYTRLQNPTNDFYAIFNICQAGDHFVTSNEIYGGTYNLFGVTMKKLGIECTFVNQEASEEEIQNAFRPNTKLLFGETISNPGCKVLDIEKFAKIAHKNGVPLIIDNTFATPVNCRPFEWGCDIVTHSTTKYMDGHATQVGGCIVDSGNFDWEQYAEKFPGLTTPDESYHGLTYTKTFGKMAYTTKLVSQLMRDLGSIPAPQNSFLLNLGLETLHLRMRQHCENALKVAKFLENDERIAWVNYPGLESHPTYEINKKYLKDNFAGILGFGVEGGEEAGRKVIEKLELFSILANIGDAKSLAIHPASTTHQQLSPEEQEATGVTPDFIRLSIGLEDVNDLIDDLSQALDSLE